MTAPRSASPGGASQVDRAGRTWRFHPAWLLLFSVPLSLVVAAGALMVAGLATCGVSGCSGGGFGPSYGSWWQILLPLLVGGVGLYAGLALPPWGAARVRQAAGLVVGGLYVVGFELLLLASQHQ